MSRLVSDSREHLGDVGSPNLHLDAKAQLLYSANLCTARKYNLQKEVSRPATRQTEKP